MLPVCDGPGLALANGGDVYAVPLETRIVRKLFRPIWRTPARLPAWKSCRAEWRLCCVWPVSIRSSEARLGVIHACPALQGEESSRLLVGIEPQVLSAAGPNKRFSR